MRKIITRTLTKIDVNDALLQAFIETCERNQRDPSKVLNKYLDYYVRHCDHSDESKRLPEELKRSFRGAKR